MSILIRDNLKPVRQRNYLNRDFDSLKAQLLNYSRQYFPNTLKDFSENSIGGLFLELASSVGDNLSFYLDHQFNELFADTVVENVNIQRQLEQSRVEILGASPAIVPLTIYVHIPATNIGSKVIPNSDCLPIIQNGSIFPSDTGTNFTLLEDLDFGKLNPDGTYVAESIQINESLAGIPQSFIFSLTGICISGTETTETFSLGSTFTPFKQITLSNANVSDIISVYDSLGNNYYKVSSLTEDVVYRNVLNTAKDNDLIKDSLKIIPAPYRYISSADLATRRTTLTLGGGNASTLDDDIIPDPSDFAISFPYSRTFSRVPVNPNSLLQTKTLGVYATNCTLSVNYRYGGGLSHNVAAGSITSVGTLKMTFPKNPPIALAGIIRSKVEVNNKIKALNGEDAPSSDDLKSLIPASRNAQERIVTREDLLARIYTLPSNFGRVFRANVRSNPNNPLASQLFIVSRDINGKLTTSSDTLKQNLVKYINPYRMITDSLEILDAKIVSIGLNFDVLVDPTLNKSIVLQNALAKLQKFFDIKNFNIDQPIILSDIQNNIYSNAGILSVNNIQLINITGKVNNRQYSNVAYDIFSNTKQGIVFAPAGGIFECKFPANDIVGKAVV